MFYINKILNIIIFVTYYIYIKLLITSGGALTRKHIMMPDID
jgi:hypothetical protein